MKSSNIILATALSVLCSNTLGAEEEKVGIESIISKKALTSYLTKYSDATDNKAFAQSESGVWNWRSNRTSVEYAKSSALIACRADNKNYEKDYPCQLIDVNGKFYNLEVNM
ncbi:MAG: hypothetical protein HRU20_15210 [Pseudomonadales bacterium]|nr:hypothetical protein [Pseudomonadales bacterium]